MCGDLMCVLTVSSTYSPISYLPRCFKSKSILLHEFVVRWQVDVESIDYILNLNYLSMQ